MATLIYSPAIKVHIETSKGILDISEDIVSWQLQLRENAIHVFSFKLQNAQRKYDGQMLPMDRITIGLKRINWLQNFTGYLNSSPVFQAWPGTLDLTASCSLKVPQFRYWDATGPDSLQLVTDAFQQAGLESSDVVHDSDNAFQSLIINSMTKVLDWPRENIHIGQIPKSWYAFAERVGNTIQQDTALYQQLGGGYALNGDPVGGQYRLPIGTYGKHSWSQTQVNNASTIINTIRNKLNNNTESIWIMSLMCAMQESSLLNRYNPNVPGSEAYMHDDNAESTDHLSVGLFQQQVPMWGPVQRCQNPEASTEHFVQALLQKYNQAPVNVRLDYGAMIQSVQDSADPGAYSQWEPDATAMVQAYQKLMSASRNTAAPPFGTVNLGGGVSGDAYTTGGMIAQTAMNLIAAHKTNPIIYQEGGDDPDSTDIDQVKTLDCSSLVDWVYYQANGKKHLWPQSAGRSNVQWIYDRSVSIPLEVAKYIQGAVLINPPNNHVGISLGDGTNHVAAHMAYADPTKDVDISPIDGNGFTVGGLLPGVDYSQSATTTLAALKLQQVLKLPKTPTLAPNLPNIDNPTVVDPTASPNDPFQGLVTGLYFNQQADALAASGSLAGPVMLINDQPFLPWLQNVINSSMRSFCSAPNGDLIAWFPDYFGQFKTAAKMIIEPIELQDFAVYWSDQQMVTHQFVLGNPGVSAFDAGSGTIGYTSDVPTDLTSLAQNTSGVATMDYPEIFEAIYGEVADSGFIQTFLDRFGARPDVVQMPYIARGKGEFFMALYLFMQRWAGQFTARVPLTFMPELFPGMLLQIPAFGFQAYVQGVTHVGNYGQGGGFTTMVDICAPSVIGSKSKNTLLRLLPRGGKT